MHKSQTQVRFIIGGVFHRITIPGSNRKGASNSDKFSVVRGAELGSLKADI